MVSLTQSRGSGALLARLAVAVVLTCALLVLPFVPAPPARAASASLAFLQFNMCGNAC